MPPGLADVTVVATEPGAIPGDVRLLFSALPGSTAGPVEEDLAAAGFAVCSNASSHRMDPDVPLLIPDVNPDHTALIPTQQARRGWATGAPSPFPGREGGQGGRSASPFPFDKLRAGSAREGGQGGRSGPSAALRAGFIVTNPNCTTTHLVCALKPLHDAFGLVAISVVSMQAVSGAGYPGVASLDILDNVIPYIAGEEEKVETEPRKLLGTLDGDAITPADFVVSAQCNRVAVLDGHTEAVAVKLKRPATREEVAAAFTDYRSEPQRLGLPSAPDPAIILHAADDRPQPRLDRLAGRGMATNIGRLRPDPLFDYKFIVLGHNTIRGAAGGAILNAELLCAQGSLT
jgi:aspartate-semialdehyde dehydrogenase